MGGKKKRRAHVKRVHDDELDPAGHGARDHRPQQGMDRHGRGRPRGGRLRRAPREAAAAAARRVMVFFYIKVR